MRQEVEGTKPGDYTFGPSSIVGNAYKQDVSGQRQYLQPPVQAGAPQSTIKVLPFPEKDKPASFNGAVGPFDTFKVTLLSSPKMNVGDKMLLNVAIGGKGQVENVPLPELCCQPGFSGQFQLSDLPPKEEMKGTTTKQFTVEMRVLSPTLTQIPPVEFSYFDPALKTYQKLNSQAIPITIAQIQPQVPPAEKPPKSQPEADTAASHGNVAKQLAPIEIEGITPLKMEDLNDLSFGTWNVLWSLPIALAALLLQLNFYKAWQEERKKIKTKSARDLFEEAMQAPQTSFYRLLNQAFMLRLKEEADPEVLETASALPEEGMAGQVRTFLLAIEEKRFTGQEAPLDQALQIHAKTLFEEI